MKLKAKLWVTHGGGTVFGRGRAALLEQIERTGSISAAAREMGLSYRHAWTMITESEKRLSFPLVERTRGGRGGGGARLTENAKRLLEKFRALEEEVFKKTEEGRDELLSACR